ncbi:MAG: ABC transporter permease [Promethearchaeota archaeon]
MGRFIARRTLDSIILLLATILFNFFLFRIMPGDPTIAYLGRAGQTTPEFRIRMIQRYGLDKPIEQQFIIYLQSLLRLDLGESITMYEGTPVAEVIFSFRLLNTFLLMGVAIALSFLIALALGTFAASRFKSKSDLTSIFVTLTTYSTPVFWIGLLIIYFFYSQLNILPVGGAPRIEDVRYGGNLLAWLLDYIYHMIGPVITLTISFVGGWFLIARDQMLGIFREDYITTARAKGLPERRVLFTHARKNAMLPMISLLALAMTFLVAGATLTETVFSWPGIGLLTFDAVYQHDYPLLQGIFLLVAVVAIAANFAADVLYGFLDPRIRY